MKNWKNIFFAATIFGAVFAYTGIANSLELHHGPIATDDEAAVEEKANEETASEESAREAENGSIAY